MPGRGHHALPCRAASWSANRVVTRGGEPTTQQNIDDNLLGGRQRRGRGVGWGQRRLGGCVGRRDRPPAAQVGRRGATGYGDELREVERSAAAAAALFAGEAPGGDRA